MSASPSVVARARDRQRRISRQFVVARFIGHGLFASTIQLSGGRVNERDHELVPKVFGLRDIVDDYLSRPTS